MKPKGRVRLVVRGAVQGVGFRPFVYRLATELGLAGWVTNSAQGVVIESEGSPANLREFERRLLLERPARAVIQSCDGTPLESLGESGFEIRESTDAGGKSAWILPDLATCSDCLREIFDRENRRFCYPFTNCTNCGPRFSIIESLPYDRARTTMRKFALCEECAREYGDPADRRFHAEPTACPRCGPELQFRNSLGETEAVRDAALRAAARELRAGRIVALKGVGGFQLLVDAGHAAAVRELRARKQRPEKPFAVMFPTLDAVRAVCLVTDLEASLLTSPEAPIVLLTRAGAGDWEAIAPRNPNLGAMLPSSPLHHLLLGELGFPVVATSGNLSDEPICIDETEASERLRGLADFFLVHNRPIVRHVDDSIVRVLHGRDTILRRARGYAPLPVQLKDGQPTTLALGAHLKNTVALALERDVFLSQHIGDLATQQAHEAFLCAASDLPRLYEATPALVAHDLHPEYLSTKQAARMPGRKVGVQHHWAHVAAAMAEHELEPPLLGVAWDGTGYGLDGTIWGGEFFLVTEKACQRFAHFRTFPLPGSEAAVREPRRAALGLLYEIFGAELWDRAELLHSFTGVERKAFRRMLERQINCPRTSSVGRLFDGVAALAGLRARSSFEGQAAMELEFAVSRTTTSSYPCSLGTGRPAVIDWEPALREVLEEPRPEIVAARFHHFLSDIVVAVARRAAQPRVILSGGCFQNRYLTERTIDSLSAAGFQPFWPQRVPPNDGGIALGQVFLAASPLREIR